MFPGKRHLKPRQRPPPPPKPFPDAVTPARKAGAKKAAGASPAKKGASSAKSEVPQIPAGASAVSSAAGSPKKKAVVSSAAPESASASAAASGDESAIHMMREDEVFDCPSPVKHVKVRNTTVGLSYLFAVSRFDAAVAARAAAAAGSAAVSGTAAADGRGNSVSETDAGTSPSKAKGGRDAATGGVGSENGVEGEKEKQARICSGAREASPVLSPSRQASRVPKRVQMTNESECSLPSRQAMDVVQFLLSKYKNVNGLSVGETHDIFLDVMLPAARRVGEQRRERLRVLNLRALGRRRAILEKPLRRTSESPDRQRERMRVGQEGPMDVAPALPEEKPRGSAKKGPAGFAGAKDGASSPKKPAAASAAKGPKGKEPVGAGERGAGFEEKEPEKPKLISEEDQFRPAAYFFTIGQFEQPLRRDGSFGNFRQFSARNGQVRIDSPAAERGNNSFYCEQGTWLRKAWRRASSRRSTASGSGRFGSSFPPPTARCCSRTPRRCCAASG